MSMERAAHFVSASGRLIRWSSIMFIAVICLAFVCDVRAAEETEIVEKLGCTADLNGYFFNLKPLGMPIDPSDRAGSEVYNAEFTTAEGPNTIQFNFCDVTARSCPDLVDDYANIINANQTCNHLSRVLGGDEERPGTMSLISESQPELGVMMEYKGGNMCNETAHYQLLIQVNCNPNLETTQYALDNESLNTPCDPKIILNSPHGCPVMSIGPLGRFINNYAWFLGLPMIIIGGFFVSAGGQHPTSFFFLFTTVAVALIMLFSLYIWILPSAFMPDWSVFVLSFVTFAMGGGLGYGAAKWPKIGILVIGFCLGALVGFAIHATFIVGTYHESNRWLIDWAIILGSGGMASLVCIVLMDYAVIIASGVFGAYILIRGLSMYSGGFTSEYSLLLATENEEFNQISGMMWCYILAITLIAFASIRAQIGHRRHNLELYKYKAHNTGYASYQQMRAQHTNRRQEQRMQNSEDEQLDGNMDYGDE